jgi:CxxC motif-containing protein
MGETMRGRMDNYTREELEEALQIVSSTITRCEKAQPKFVEGTSQHTLLKNRIKALCISKLLITHKNIMEKYTKDEVVEALRAVSSIISKCEKAQHKFAAGTSHHTRCKKMIKAMQISKTLITGEISKRG